MRFSSFENLNNIHSQPSCLMLMKLKNLSLLRTTSFRPYKASS